MSVDEKTFCCFRKIGREDILSTKDSNVLETMINMINHPFGNGLYHPFMVIQGMVYYCFNYSLI